MRLKLTLNKSEYYYPVTHVSNNVVYVNPHFKNVFQGLRKDSSSSLALFLDSSKLIDDSKILQHNEKYLDSIKNKSVAFSTYGLTPGKNAIISTNHTRSSIVFKTAFRLSDYSSKHPYPDFVQDVELKGCGYHRAFILNSFLSPKKLLVYGKESGIQNLKNANEDLRWTEYLASKGVRVVPHIAHLKLNELIFEGKQYSIFQAKFKQLIPTNVTPVLIVRGFGTRNRLQDLSNVLTDSPAIHVDLNMINQTLDVIKKEYSLKRRLSVQDYSLWFVENLAKQIKILNLLGFKHFSLTKHQVTLDCRLLDFAGSEMRSDLPEASLVALQKSQYKKGYSLVNDFSLSIGKILYRKLLDNPKSEIDRDFLLKGKKKILNFQNRLLNLYTSKYELTELPKELNRELN